MHHAKNRMRSTLLGGLLLGLTATAAQATVPNQGQVPDSYIVKIASGVDPDVAASDIAVATGAGVGHVYRHAFNGFAARIPAARLGALQRHPLVVSVVPDRYVSIAAPPPGKGPGKGDGGGGSKPPQVVPTGVKRIHGDLSSTQAGDGAGSVDVDVAVVDTGISNHADLNVVGGYNCSTGKSFKDGNGHGTHVAGTIAAIDDSSGVVGVAPGARLWAVRVLNNAGSGTWSSVICGIDWVAANAVTIEVANMSLGGSGNDAGGCNDGGMHEAICNAVNKGVTFVVAAGNESDDAANHVPAAYDEVITVSALADFDGLAGGLGAPTCRADVDDTFADFSNFGADVDLIAPGVCIESTWNDGSYNTISGTSMAAPHVAGAAALYRANNPSATPGEVKSAMQGAGNNGWDATDDSDSIKEMLLDVSGF